VYFSNNQKVRLSRYVQRKVLHMATFFAFDSRKEQNEQFYELGRRQKGFERSNRLSLEPTVRSIRGSVRRGWLGAVLQGSQQV